MTDQHRKNEDASPAARLRRAADRLLVLLGELLEGMTPEQLDMRALRSISSTLKDLQDLQDRTQQESGRITVVLEGEVEGYAQ